MSVHNWSSAGAWPSRDASHGRLSGSSTYGIKDARLAASDNRSAKTADGRMAAEVARL